MIEETFNEWVKKKYLQGKSLPWLSQKTGMYTMTLRNILLRMDVPLRNHGEARRAQLRDVPEYACKHLPTIEEIAEECAKIRAGWNAEEELRRRVVPYEPVSVMAIISGKRRKSDAFAIL